MKIAQKISYSGKRFKLVLKARHLGGSAFC